MLIGDKVEKDYNYFYREVNRSQPIYNNVTNTIKYSTTKHGTIKHGTTKHGTTKHDSIKHDSIKHDYTEKYKNKSNVSNIYSTFNKISIESNIIHSTENKKNSKYRKSK